ncbi:hypothetical protein AB0I34_34830 [Kribbella sp. NPDC050281]|uniref:hypothetical protein n=1 Tax=Kribbella sp. NPDC050281 TaxID=3155515 RepID=UPI0033C79520
MQTTTAQFAQNRSLASDQGSEPIRIGGAPSRAQLGLDGVKSGDQFANGTGVMIAHGASPGRKIGARLSEAEPL